MQITKPALLVSSLLIACAATDTAAQEKPRTQPAYNYASVSFADYDGGDALTIEGGLEFNSPYFVSGHYRNIDSNATSGSRDSFGLNLGRYFWLNSGLIADVQARVGRVDFGPLDSNYWGAEANLRQRVDQFEFYAGVGYLNYTDAGSDNIYQFGVNYFLNQNTSVGVGYQDSEYGDGVRLRASYHF